MFNYSDPTGGTFLSSVGALPTYRRIVDQQYQRSGNLRGSGFATLDAFAEVAQSGGISPAEIRWRAYPLSRAGFSDEEIDADRFELQDEYVEWHVEKSGDAIDRVTFTTEFPEYYQAVATIGASQVADAVAQLYSGAAPTNIELFGTNDPSVVNDPAERAKEFRKRLRSNPWNNGQRGILCLTQGDNTMDALFGLVDQCAIPRPAVPVGSVCASPFCGRDRDSDPQICAASQSQVRAANALTLADPVGVEILGLGGNWTLDGVAIPDVNADPAVWQVSRNGRRAVLSVRPGLELNGTSISTGTQIARVLEVRAVVQVVADAMLPAWARIGNEGTRA